MKGNLKLETTRPMKNCMNATKFTEFGTFPYNITLPTPDSFWPPYERLYFAKHATSMSPQSLIKLICSLTRRQKSSGTLQTLTLRKSLLKIPVFNNSINAKY